MMKPALARALAALAALAPAPLLAQGGLAIEHKPVGCIVVGKHPKLGACFSPAAELARARVYFRPEAVTNWYYVEMASDAPCFAGILPKPSKKLLKTRVHYYLETQDRAFSPSRTSEYQPLVVGSQQECEKDPAAYLPRAAVKVFPSMPPGFIGGPPPLALVGAGAAVAAGVGAGVAVASGDDETPPTTPPTTAPPPVTTAPPPPPPPPTTLPALRVFCTATPSSGNAPLRVRLEAFPNGGNGIYDFTWQLGDGGDSHEPRLNHTYQKPGTYTAVVTVTSAGQTAACDRRIVVGSPPPAQKFTLTVNSSDDRPTPTATPPPSGNVTIDPPGQKCPSEPSVTGGLDCISTHPEGTGVTITATPGFATECATWGGDCASLGSQGGMSTCEVTMDQDRNVTVNFNNTCDIILLQSDKRPKAAVVAERVLSWASQLEIPGAAVQVVLNGRSGRVAGSGRFEGQGARRTGENRIEATLILGSGRPGTWRFELGQGQGLESGSLRVLTGEVALITAEAVVFRLKGRPGERVVFAFRLKD